MLGECGVDGGATNSQCWCDAFSQSVPVLGVVAVGPLEACGHAAHDFCSFVSSILIFEFRDHTLESERLGEFLCAHFEDFCFALKEVLILQLFQFRGHDFHRKRIHRTLIPSHISSHFVFVVPWPRHGLCRGTAGFSHRVGDVRIQRTTPRKPTQTNCALLIGR